VCIVGAGIAGLTTAYLLAREGRRVVVLDDGPLAGGMTERTTAHLTHAIDDRIVEIERLHGEKGARIAVDSHTAAIERIASIAEEEGIDCELERVDGYLFAAPGDPEDLLVRELEAAHRAGLGEVVWVDRAPLPAFETGPCLRFPRQAQFHPLKYLAGLVPAIERLGGRLFTGTHATSVEGGGAARVETRRGAVVTAEAIVVATNTPVNDRFAIHTKQVPYTTYVVGIAVPRESVPRALYWDTGDPYHYVRLETVSGHDVLIVGGEDHKTAQADDGLERFSRLEAWARERFPSAGRAEYRWSGQVMEPVDGVAFIGRNPGDAPNVYIATGDSGMGMTHGTIAGILITDLVMGRESPWEALYDPSRKTARALGTYARENLNVAGRLAVDYLSPGEVDSADEIPAGEGAILRRGLTKVAVYRDGDGGLHERSALCTHLGCIVAWNRAEKSWDCPCHGSRFDRYGQVITGPANVDLSPAED
jgi:glycine/D-amino acid oxidase-like deaminating enzyme/nitrite reductase/ring-hydroxylating ferredoxin subunit